MQTCVRVKRRFGRSAVSVFLRDKLKHSDLETGRFFIKTCRFFILAASGAIFARYRSASFFKRFVSEIVPFSKVSFRKLFRFPAKPTRFVIARRARAPDAAIFNRTICHSVANYGCTERNRTLKERERKRNEAANLMFFVIGISSCFVLPCFATGCHTFNFKIATAALRPRNDTKMVGFAIKPTIYISKMFEIRLAGAPCFATGCHTFGLKIATAALRPRNDTKNGRFCNKICHLYFQNV